MNKLLIDDTPDGIPGPVDFRSLSVREFGTIYEGLLQSELSLAQTDLGLDKDGLYEPKTREKDIVVRAGEIYLHNASGKRKATGSYYTKSFAVEHLLDHALEPALDDHLARLEALRDSASSDDFFDFRVADNAMGSGHFLVAAIDRVEKRFSTHLARHHRPAVTNELARLREHAGEILAEYGESLTFDDTQLLRRQIARRCIYGVDLNPLAVELARLSIWVHTFVPGLPLSLLDYNLVRGNSLVGIATTQKAKDILSEGYPLWTFNAMSLLGDAQEQLDKIARLADADASQIKEARAAYEAARESLVPSAALFDILAASRLNDDLRESIALGITSASEGVRQGLPNSAPHQVARETLKATPRFHFPVAFPQVFLRERAGFDVILGNPPWEGAKLDENRFWTRYMPGLQSMTQREQENARTEWRELRPDLVVQYRQELVKTDLIRDVLVTGPFPGMGIGNPDFYKAFLWRFWELVNRPYGHIGIVVPRSVLASIGTAPFRKKVLQYGTLTDLTSLVNSRGWVFDDAEHRYTIVLFALHKIKSDSETTLPMRGPYSSLIDYKKGLQRNVALFSLADVLSWTKTAALPLLPDDFATNVFVQMRKVPNLVSDDGTGWCSGPYRELDSSEDKKHMEFVRELGEGWWPVYKGESFGIWQPETGIYYARVNSEEIFKRLYPKRLRANRMKNSVFHNFSKE